MTTRTVWVYSEQELTPRAFDVLKTIKATSGFDDVSFQPYQANIGVKKVLCFGNQAPADVPYGVELIHTYSIAQMMGKPNALTVITASLKLYFGEPHKPRCQAPTVPMHLLLSPADVGFYYDRPVVIDIETDGNLGKTHTPEDVNVISIAMYQPSRYQYTDGMSPPVVWCFGREGAVGTEPLPQDVLDMFARELPKFSKAIYHNGKFDTRVLNRVLGVKLCVWFDTMLAHHTLNHAAAMNGLKELAHRYLGAPDWEGDIKKYTKAGGHYELIPRKLLIDYNGWDVYWTYQLYELFHPMIEADPDFEVCFNFELAEAEFLLEVEQNGIPINEEAAKTLAVEQEYIMLNRATSLAVLTGMEKFNPGSHVQVKKAVEKFKGIKLTTTDEAMITELKKNYPHDAWIQNFCTLLIEYRKASKIRGTYALGWLKETRDGRVHPTFLVHGTSTGRLSSKAPNAQNMPRDKKIRKIVSV